MKIIAHICILASNNLSEQIKSFIAKSQHAITKSQDKEGIWISVSFSKPRQALVSTLEELASPVADRLPIVAHVTGAFI